MLIQNWLDILASALMSVVGDIITFIPNLLGAILLLIIGLIIAKSMEFTVEKIIAAIKLDSLLKKINVNHYLNQAGITLNSGKFFGEIIYWIIVIIFAMVIADVLGLPALSLFITSALSWVFSNFIVAILILLVTAFIAQFLKRIVSAAIIGAKLHSAKFLGSVTWWMVMIFGAITALRHLGVDTRLFESVLMSFITAAPLSIGLAIGLAFGLGGKKQAERILDRLEDTLENR